MSPNQHDEYKVGIFAGIGLLLFIATVILLGGDKAFFASRYSLKVAFQTVEGIANGSVVQLSGLKVGNVTAVEFIHDKNQLVVTMKIDQKFQYRITEGSLAGVRTQGALGDKFVYITPGPLDTKPLNDGDTIATDNEKDFLTTLAQRGDEFQKAFDILNELHKFTSGLNEGGGARTLMTNLTESSSGLKQAIAHLDAILKDVHGEKEGDSKLKQSLAHLSSILQKVDSGQGSLGGLINDSAVHDRLKEMLGASERKKSMRNIIRDTIEKGSQ